MDGRECTQIKTGSQVIRHPLDVQSRLAEVKYKAKRQAGCIQVVDALVVDALGTMPFMQALAVFNSPSGACSTIKVDRILTNRPRPQHR